MSKQLIDPNAESRERSDEPEVKALDEGAAPEFRNESDFREAVRKVVQETEWEWFHIPEKAYETAAQGANRSIPGGFPDLLLRRRDIRGNCDFIVAELKTNIGVVKEDQQRFLEDFAKIAPTFVLRSKDWDYVVHILKNGPPDTNGKIIEPSPPIIRSREWLPPERAQNAIVFKIAEDLKAGDFSRGDLAELRRMKLDDVPPGAFWRIMAQRGLLGRIEDREIERRWALVVHGIALMTPNAHDRTVPIGKALFEGGESGRKKAFYHEIRLTRLSAARGAILESLLIQLFRMMGNAGQPFDWQKMATLILSEESNPEKAEEVREDIAKSYYETEYRNSQAKEEGDS